MNTLSLKNRSLVLLFLFGCSDAETTTPSVSDAGSGSDSGTVVMNDAGTTKDAALDTGIDVAQPMFSTCTDAELDADDHTANGADVSFGTAVAQYTNHCVRIKAGQSVEFVALSGSFADHPLVNNGEAATPIPNTNSGTTTDRITFPTAGKFSYHCGFHAATMWGTVKVIP